MRSLALVVLLAMLGVGGHAFRTWRAGPARSSPARACGAVVGVVESDGTTRLACPDDPVFVPCLTQGRPPLVGERHRGCDRVGPLPGAVLRMHGLPIDVNRASAEDLRAVDGLGASLAARLVEAREAGPFCSPEDLERVKGIGPRKREAFATVLSFIDERCHAE